MLPVPAQRSGMLKNAIPGAKQEALDKYAVDLTEKALDALDHGDKKTADDLLDQAKSLDPSAVEEIVADLDEAEADPDEEEEAAEDEEDDLDEDEDEEEDEVPGIDEEDEEELADEEEEDE